MRQTILRLVVSLFLFCGLRAAQAQNIVYTFDGTGSGTLDNVPFSEAAFTITAYADTSTIVNCGSAVLSVDNISADIAISGFDDAAFSVPTRLFDNQSVSVAGFSNGGCSGGDLMDLLDMAFQTYDLSTSIGPIFVAFPFAVGQFHDVPTSGGILTMSSAHDVTFNAVTLSPGNRRVRQSSSSAVSGSGVHGIVNGVAQ